MMKRILGSKLLQLSILTCLVFWLAVGNFVDFRYRDVMRFFSFDTLNRLSPREAGDNVMIVDIDEETLKRLGQWPFPRNILAEMVTSMNKAGAKAIVFDMVFAEEDRSSPHLMADKVSVKASNLQNYDKIFAKAIADAGNVVTGFTATEKDGTRRMPRETRPALIRRGDRAAFAQGLYSPAGVTTNIPVLSDAAAGNGTFIALPDSDGINREVPILINFGDKFYPSLAIEALRVAYARGGNLKIGSQAYIPDDKKAPFMNILTRGMYHVKIGESGLTLPVDEEGRIYTKFRKLDRDKDYISAYKLMDKAFAGEVSSRLKDKIVFVGTSAAGMKDIRSSPLQTYIPGVEIHFNVVEQILQQDFLYYNESLSREYESVMLFTVGFFLVLLSLGVSVIVLTSMLGLIVVTLLGVSYYGYMQYGVMFDPLYSSFCLVLVFIAAVIWNYIRTETRAKEIRSAFGLYISPQFMQELTKHPDKLKLGGEIRELTVMFTDIRNFTTIAENMTPEELIVTMNDFLTPMSDVVMGNRGTIDKYMGDAMMAFWNAPLDDDEHAAHAVEAALKMKNALAPVNKALVAKAQKEGKEALTLAAGIGVNTGLCSVGNMGSRQRFAYSALGDTVNLSSRLEGQTKAYGLDLLIGEETAAQVKDFAILEMDKIRVKGKARPVRIFTVLGDRAVAKTADFVMFRVVHERFLDEYRRMKWDEALDSLRAARDMPAAAEIIKYYQVMEDRIKAFQANGCDPDWDGVYVAKTK